MGERWWAPTRPTVDPDAVVLALLQPSGEAKGDLGATLLAVHRAGAAACEAVSKGAVPSEKGLITTLADVRSRVAGQVVDAAASSMEARYAGLFVRDFFDDAEQGALHVYRTAVSKGVSPPIAAHRAADIYGVPGKQMGRYVPLANDPKASPAALIDAADRVLLTYISKTVAIESAPDLVEFTKANTTTLDFDDEEHPRGADGRFVNSVQSPVLGRLEILGELRGGGPRVATRPEEVTTPVKRVQRVQRVKRKQVKRVKRVARVERAEPDPDIVPVAARRSSAAGAAEPKAARRSSAERLPTERELVVHAAVRSTRKPSKDLVPFYAVPDMMREFKDQGNQPAYEMPEQLVFPVDTKVSDSIQVKLREQAGGQRDPTSLIFRMGRLMEMSGHPEPLLAGGEDEKERMDRANEVRLVDEAFKQKTAKPKVHVIKQSEINRALGREMKHSASALKEYLESERLKEFTHAQQLPDGSWQAYSEKEENDFVEVYDTYRRLGINHQDEPQYVAIVHWQPMDDADEYDRPIPVETEYVIRTDAVGYHDGPHNEYFRLNKNTVYKVVHPPTHSEATPLGPEVMFDTERNVVVNRYYIRAIDDIEVEEIISDPEDRDWKGGKSVDFEEEDHPRGEGGKFIAAIDRPSSPVAPVLPTRKQPGPVKRVQRVQRNQVKRVQRVQRAPQDEASEEEIVPKPARRSSTRAVTEHGDDLTATPAHRIPLQTKSPLLLRGDAVYRVLANDEFFDIEDALSKTDLWRLRNGEIVPLSKVAARRITSTEHAFLPPEQVGDYMRLNTEMELSNKRGEIETKSLGNMMAGLVPDHEAIAETVRDLYLRNPNVDQIEIVRRGVVLEFYGNKNPAKPQYMLEIDKAIDPNAPMVMRYMGEHRAHEVTVEGTDDDDETSIKPVVDLGFSTGEHTVENPRLHIFKVTNPVVRHIAMGNQ